MVAMHDDVMAGSENFRAVRLRNCIAALDLMTAKTQQMLAELELGARDEVAPLKPNRSSILQLYVSRLDQSIEARCQNLRSTLRAIERERLRAQNELGDRLRASAGAGNGASN
jgi:hypothetical protein